MRHRPSLGFRNASPMKRHLSLIVVCALAICIGCDSGNKGGGGSTSEGGKSKGTIGVSLITLDNPFFKVIGDNIELAGKKHGYDVVVVSGDKDVAKQGSQIKNFIVQKVSAIVLSPCDSKAIVPVIQDAN